MSQNDAADPAPESATEQGRGTGMKGHDLLSQEDARTTSPPAEGDLRLPHERDESPDLENTGGPAAAGPRQVIEQAASDLSRGLRDTDLHGVPSDVPSPGPTPDDSPGADVPLEGVDRRNYAKHQKSDNSSKGS